MTITPSKDELEERIKKANGQLEYHCNYMLKYQKEIAWLKKALAAEIERNQGSEEQGPWV